MPHDEVAEDEVVGYVRGFLAGRGLPADTVTANTAVAELGLDSIGLVELLLTARDELVAQGRIRPDVSFVQIPRFDRIGELARLLTELTETTA